MDCQENSDSVSIPGVRALQHGGQAGGHHLLKNGLMSIHHWSNNWTWDGELLNLTFTWGFCRMTDILWFIKYEAYSMPHTVSIIIYFQTKISFILSCSNVGPVINLYLLSHLLETHQRLVRSKPKTFPALWTSSNKHILWFIWYVSYHMRHTGSIIIYF